MKFSRCISSSGAWGTRAPIIRVPAEGLVTAGGSLRCFSPGSCYVGGTTPFTMRGRRPQRCCDPPTTAFPKLRGRGFLGIKELREALASGVPPSTCSLNEGRPRRWSELHEQNLFLLNNNVLSLDPPLLFFFQKDLPNFVG